MGLVIQFWRDFQLWETSSKLAFFFALALFPPLLWLVLNTQDNARTIGLISLAGLGLTLQVIVLWGNRHMVTPYTKAQRAFLSGDLARAQELLEGMVESARARQRPVSVDTYVLLGNVYRQQGNLVQSEAILARAVDEAPDYHFALYGYGKTLLAMGNYHEALTRIKNSLSLGAPSVVQFDVGHVAFRLGDWQEAGTMLEAVLPTLDEPHRILMAKHLLNCMARATFALDDVVPLGMPLWEREARLYAHTPYGQALLADVRAWQKQSQDTRKG
jgi:tetratricopeptide (TPR) repeat protein